MLGHANPSMTLDIYADLSDEDLDGVADRLIGDDDHESVDIRVEHNPTGRQRLAGIIALVGDTFSNHDGGRVKRNSTTAPGLASPVTSRLGKMRWWVRPSTPSITE